MVDSQSHRYCTHYCLCVHACMYVYMHACVPFCVCECMCVHVHDAVVSLRGQMYIKFAQSQEELRQAQDEVTRLTNYLEHIRQGACA